MFGVGLFQPDRPQRDPPRNARRPLRPLAPARANHARRPPELHLAPLPRHKALGVCHFPTFRAAMEATRHIVALGPAAVEVVDRTLLDLARDIPLFRPTLETFVRGRPGGRGVVTNAESMAQALRGETGTWVEG